MAPWQATGSRFSLRAWANKLNGTWIAVPAIQSLRIDSPQLLRPKAVIPARLKRESRRNPDWTPDKNIRG
jgi:hypothetical protein